MDGKPTCSCTIAKLENNQKATVKPGESTTIDLEWNTKEFHDDYSQGATFGTNAPSLDSFKLAVTGKVYPPVVVYPPEMIQFSTISNEEPHRTRIAVYSKDRPTMKVTKVMTSKPGLIVAEAMPMTAEEAKRLKVEAGYNVDVEVKPGMPVGQFHEELVIETDHPKRSEVKVSVGGKVIGPISVVPPGLRKHDITSREGASQDLTLMVRGGKETQFEVVSAPEKLKVAVVPDDSPGMKGRYRLTVTVPPGTPSGTIEGEIILKTDHPLVSELKIPVDIFILRSAPRGREVVGSVRGSRPSNWIPSDRSRAAFAALAFARFRRISAMVRWIILACVGGRPDRGGDARLRVFPRHVDRAGLRAPSSRETPAEARAGRAAGIQLRHDAQADRWHPFLGDQERRRG